MKSPHESGPRKDEMSHPSQPQALKQAAPESLWPTRRWGQGAGRGKELCVASKHDHTWATGNCLCQISPSHLGHNINRVIVCPFTQLSNQREVLKAVGGGAWFSEDHFIGPSTLLPGTENLSLTGFEELCLKLFRNPGFICVAVGFGLGFFF